MRFRSIVPSARIKCGGAWASKLTNDVRLCAIIGEIDRLALLLDVEAYVKHPLLLTSLERPTELHDAQKWLRNDHHRPSLPRRHSSRGSRIRDSLTQGRAVPNRITG